MPSSGCSVRPTSRVDIGGHRLTLCGGGRPMSMIGKTITLCMFYTSTGVDIAVYADRHDAHMGAAITMLASLLEIGNWDTRQAILDAILREDYIDALDMFGAATGQTFEFDE